MEQIMMPIVHSRTCLDGWLLINICESKKCCHVFLDFVAQVIVVQIIVAQVTV